MLNDLKRFQLLNYQFNEENFILELSNMDSPAVEQSPVFNVPLVDTLFQEITSSKTYLYLKNQNTET